LRFGNLIALEPGGPRLRSVLGGTGIAISASCKNVSAALDYAGFVAGGNAQKTIYLHAGGQPSHRAAWDDPAANALCGEFFSGTRLSQEEAFVRPRYSGYAPLQTKGGHALQETLRDGRSPQASLEELDALYRQSRQSGRSQFQQD
jgi:multiple sugar transport system substrate-binding protein